MYGSSSAPQHPFDGLLLQLRVIDGIDIIIQDLPMDFHERAHPGVFVVALAERSGQLECQDRQQNNAHQPCQPFSFHVNDIPQISRRVNCQLAVYDCPSFPRRRQDVRSLRLRWGIRSPMASRPRRVLPIHRPGSSPPRRSEPGTPRRGWNPDQAEEPRLFHARAV